MRLYQLKNIRISLNSVLLLIMFYFLTSCASFRRFVVKETFPVIENTEEAILTEENEVITEQSLPFAIKLAEGMYGFAPTPAYASKISLLYAAYTLAYVDEGPYSDFEDDADKKILASQLLYQKSKDYALLALDKRVKDFSKSIYLPEAVPETLDKVKKRDIEALFWLDFSWAMLLFLDLSDVTILAHADTIRQIAERTAELNSDYYYGAPYVLLMAYYGARNATIGGNPKKALEYYSLAKEKSLGLSLIPYYVYMRFVAIEQGDQKGFREAYRVIETFDISKNKDIAFINVFLKRKSKELYDKRDLFF